MKIKFLSLALAFMVSQSALASNVKLGAEVCPDMDAIKAVGFEHAVDLGNYWVTMTPPSQFGTKEVWSFWFSMLEEAKDEHEAVVKGNAILNNFSPEVSGPYEQSNGRTGCVYKGSNGIAVALTPPENTPTRMLFGI